MLLGADRRRRRADDLSAGSVVFGTDLGTDARPEPVGTFSMMEMRGPAEPSFGC